MSPQASPLLYSSNFKPEQPIILADKKGSKKRGAVPSLRLEVLDSPDQVSKLVVGKTHSSPRYTPSPKCIAALRHSARNFPSKEDLLRKRFEYPDSKSNKPGT